MLTTKENCDGTEYVTTRRWEMKFQQYEMGLGLRWDLLISEVEKDATLERT